MHMLILFITLCLFILLKVSIAKTSRDYYHNNKEYVLEYQKNRYDNLTKEEKDEKAIYAKNWYNNLPEDKKKYKKSIC